MLRWQGKVNAQLGNREHLIGLCTSGRHALLNQTIHKHSSLTQIHQNHTQTILHSCPGLKVIKMSILDQSKKVISRGSGGSLTKI